MRLAHDARAFARRVTRRVNKKLKRNYEITDRLVAALLKDLKRRGAIESHARYLGRRIRPYIMAEQQHSWEDIGCRDHHPNCFSMWMAGGGIKGGQVIGKTDELGINGVEDRVHIHDLQATMPMPLPAGWSHTGELTYRYLGREFRLTDVGGQVVKKMVS